ncbi:MAG: hypothetical protein ACPGIC_04335, partial [Opitutales bacterium]
WGAVCPLEWTTNHFFFAAYIFSHSDIAILKIGKKRPLPIAEPALFQGVMKLSPSPDTEAQNHLRVIALGIVNKLCRSWPCQAVSAVAFYLEHRLSAILRGPDFRAFTRNLQSKKTE